MSDLLSFKTYEVSTLQIKFLSIIYALPRNFIGRKLALLMRKIFLLIWNQKYYDHEIEGIKARFCMIGNVCERKFFFMPQFYDKYERDFIAANLEDNSVFIDIGANVGLYSMWASK
jgi:hypothetical protein